MMNLGFAGVSFQVSCDDDLSARLRSIFPATGNAPEPTESPPLPSTDATVEIHAERVGSSYRFLLDGQLEAEDLSPGETAALVEYRIIRETALRTETHLALHGAAVARDGAMLLLGPGGSGKSGLCCELVQRGWSYLSDELALVNLESGKVSPFQRAILLKPNRIFRPPPQRPTIDDGRRYLHWDSLRPASAGMETALSRVVLCSYSRENGGERVVKLAPSEAIHEVAALCFNYHRLGATRIWKALTALLSRISVVAMHDADAGVGRCS